MTRKIYSYVGGNPMSRRDPFGLQAVDVFPGGGWTGGGMSPPTQGPLTINNGVPPGAVGWTSPNGTNFSAPPGTSWAGVYAAGQAGGMNPFAMNTAEGQFGTYDFQRDAWDDTFYSQYTNASNFGVGVYMNGAGFSQDEMLGIGWIYSLARSNVSDQQRVNQGYWWLQGWEYANRYRNGKTCN